jgi:tetratricopeptide (TPR) repeat protein
MRKRLFLSACLLVPALSAVWANGGGPMSIPRISEPRSQSPEEQARHAYNDGVREVGKADRFHDSASQLSDARKKDKSLHEAQDHYAAALSKFTQAVKLDPNMHEAWNYVGYTNRKLGNYDAALAAYERALTLHPGYPEALEYRGEAFLALNRIADAQQAYLDLFASNRSLADRLMTAMKGWVDTQHTAASAGADAATVDAMEKWLHERAQIAEQTASLTREGSASSWR